MNANKKAKAAVVKEIETRLKNAKSLAVVNYTGLTVKEFQGLRTLLTENGSEVQVYKNRLFKIAAKNVGYEGLNPSLTGSNAYAFGVDEDSNPAKVIDKYSEEIKKLELITGVSDKKVLTLEELIDVAKLPSYNEALTILAGQLIGPLRYITVGLNQLVEEGKIAA